MHGALAHRALAACLLAGLVCAATRAADDAKPLPIVVMTDGRILTGTVMKHAGGYLVERPNGRVLVPEEQVKCVATDLRDAYRQQRESQSDPTAASLIQLAEWCISYRLYDEAGDELRRALRRDPENTTARKMLARLEDTVLRRDSPRPAAPQTPIIDGMVAPEVESLGGLSRTTAAQFTTRIQPLLMNKCGGASCHGNPDKSEFRLTMVRHDNNNQRRAAERNLAAVLRYIDAEHPVESPLLQIPQGAHGGAGSAIFGGPTAADQQKMLREWVKSVAAERRAEDEQLAKRPKLKGGGKPPSPRETTPDVVNSAVAETTAPTAVQLTAGSDAESVETAERRPAPRSSDPFDPELFNQRFGGKRKP